MKIAIVGGGITGLTAAYELTKAGHSVTIFEKESFLGGLAYGFKQKNWNWHLEGAYHHLFTNDHAILSLLKEIGLEEQIIIKRPITSSLYNNMMYQLDSALSLLSFPGMPFIDRIRTGMFIAAMKINPFWQPLEGTTAAKLAEKFGGSAGWRTIWEPLMVGKFGDYSNTIAASWLWARIKKRTPSLAYIEGGFQTFINRLSEKVKQQGGKIHTKTLISNIECRISNNDRHSSFIIHYSKQEIFDRVLLTLPTPLAAKLINSQLSALNSYFSGSLTIPHLHAQVLILETKEPILKDVYWLNITDRSFPFLAVVQHTNYMDKKHYGGNHITYIGNYLPPDHPFLKLTKEQLWKKFLPYIKKISPSCNLTPDTCNLTLFFGPFAQPVQQLHYSQKAPQLSTLIPHLYLANMDSIYPWDRGTNYAVELGQKAARTITVHIRLVRSASRMWEE